MFDDCKQVPGGRPKAEAAAEALKKIFPGVVCTDITGINVNVWCYIVSMIQALTLLFY